MLNFLILHGVNLNMFGRRNKNIYGTVTLADINSALENLARELGVGIEIFQTDCEGDMIRRIHAALDENIAGIVINAGAWTHYSIAIADALDILTVPIVEIHLSNIQAREEFRRKSVLSQVVTGSICGFGLQSYLLGLRACVYLAGEKK